MLVAKEHGGSRFGVTARNASAADEQVEVAVTVDVGQGKRAGSGALAGKGVDHRFARQIVSAHHGTEFEAVFVIGGSGENERLSIALINRDDAGLIARECLIDGRAMEWNEAAFVVIAHDGKLSAAAISHDEVVPAVMIDVEPGQSRAELTQFFGQERLAFEVVKEFLVMNESEAVGDVAE